MSAFTAIETLFRSKLRAAEHVDFAQLERDYSDKYKLPATHRDALNAFRELRTAIVHKRYNNGKPIAEPVPEVVKEIENLRRLLESPPNALRLLALRIHAGVA